MTSSVSEGTEGKNVFACLRREDRLAGESRRDVIGEDDVQAGGGRSNTGMNDDGSDGETSKAANLGFLIQCKIGRAWDGGGDDVIDSVEGVELEGRIYSGGSKVDVVSWMLSSG